MDYVSINKEIGNIDIYLLDQILKGRFREKERILDAGCGEGRNLTWFIKNGYQVYGVDRSEEALNMLRLYGRSLSSSFDTKTIIQGDAKYIEWADGYFGYVISSAVLHFSETREDFRLQFKELSRVLKKEGLLFIRSMVLKGISSYQKLENGLYQLSDGSVRYLIDDQDIDWMLSQGLEWVEEPKWVTVNETRSMSVFIMRKTN